MIEKDIEDRDKSLQRLSDDLMELYIEYYKANDGITVYQILKSIRSLEIQKTRLTSQLMEE